MPDLEQKAAQRTLGEKRKVPKIIIADPMPSTSSFVKETTIKLDPKVKGRGKGKVGPALGIPEYQKQRSTGPSITAGMGGKH